MASGKARSSAGNPSPRKTWIPFHSNGGANRPDALAKIQAAAPHLLITDLNMPNMDGLQLIREVRAMPQFKYIPIIMLTTESQIEKKQAGKAAGATGWIVKPFTQEQLVAVVKKVLP